MILGLGLVASLSSGCANNPSKVEMFYSKGDDFPTVSVEDYDGIKQFQLMDSSGNVLFKEIEQPIPTFPTGCNRLLENGIKDGSYCVDVLDRKDKISSHCFIKKGREFDKIKTKNKDYELP